MAKDTEARAPGGEESTAAADEAKAAADEKMTEPELPTLDNFLEHDYEVGTWSGLPNFGCPACAFRTLQGNEVVATHYFEAHLSREEV